jgi:hypothetical protein
MGRWAINKIILSVAVALSTILTASAAYAASATIDGITVTDYGPSTRRA